MNATPVVLSPEARVPAALPRRHLAQLRKRFRHKLPVTLDEGHGRIEFPAGSCELDAAADAGTLLMRVVAGDEASLARLEEVVARHLERFAFREQPEVRRTRAARA